MGHVSYRYGQPNAVYPDTKLVGSFTVVVVSQILHKLSQIYFWFTLLLPENAKLLNNGKRVETLRHYHKSEIVGQNRH